MSDFGKGHKTNSIGWGQAQNEIGFGSTNYVRTFFTKQIIKEMIHKVDKKSISIAEQIKRIKRPEEIETIRTQVKVRTPQAKRTKRYLSSLEGSKTILVEKIHRAMLKQDNKLISLDELDKILKEYPTPVSNEGELKGRGKEAVLNQSVKSLQLYSNGLLKFTFIVTDLGIRKFTVI